MKSNSNKGPWRKTKLTNSSEQGELLSECEALSDERDQKMKDGESDCA